MLARPNLSHPDRFLLGLCAGLACALLAIALVAPLADTLARRDVINAQAVCQRTGGEVVLCGDGTWRCVAGEGR